MTSTVFHAQGAEAHVRPQRLSNRLGSLRVADAICYALLAFLVIGSTWGYTSDNVFYLLGTALGIILGIASALTKKYTNREFLIIAALFVLSAMIALTSHSLTLLLSMVVIASSKGMRIRSLLSFFLVIKLGSFILLLLFGWLGLFDTVEASHYSALVGDTVERMRINGVATNILHLGLFSIMMMLIYRGNNRLRLSSYIAMMIINVAFYYLISYSSGGLLITSMAVFLAALTRYSKVIKGIICRFSFLSVPLTTALFLYTGYRFDGTGWISELNHLTTGRIAYNHYWLTAHGITLFGVNPNGEPAAFDNSIIYLLVGLGVIAGITILVSYCSTMMRLGKRKDSLTLLFVLMFYLFSMSESILPSVVVNPSLFIVVSVLLDGFYQDDESCDSPISKRLTEKVFPGSRKENLC